MRDLRRSRCDSRMLGAAGACLLALAALACRPAQAGGFDGARALADVKAQCDFGPRVPGTDAHKACKGWIKKQIEEAGLVYSEQPFKARLALIDKTAQGWNLYGLPAAAAEWEKQTEPFIMLTAHWDTRPLADNDPPGKAGPPFLGANDGGSGVAVALGVVRALKGTPLAKRVAVAFWDAEDAGVERQMESWCVGAQFAAMNPPPWLKRMRLGINLDMIGGKGLQLGWEGYSIAAQPDAVRRLWRIGLDLAPNVFRDAKAGAYVDDHYFFINKGYPFIDLIGLPYAFWHRTGDTPEACDPKVMEAVGSVLIEFIERDLAAPAAAPGKP